MGYWYLGENLMLKSVIISLALLVISATSFAQETKQSPEEASATVETWIEIRTVDGKTGLRASCSANVCGKCAISCAEGQSANCTAGKWHGGSFGTKCTSGPVCKCK